MDTPAFVTELMGVTFYVVASNPVMCAAVLTTVNFATKVIFKVLT
jgi:hypothetical protein